MARGKKNTAKLTVEQQNLVIDNIDLAYSRAFKLYEKFKEHNLNAEKDDYISSACEGLCIAARCYKPDSKTKFSTYAFQIVDQKIKDSVLNSSLVKGIRWDEVNHHKDKEELLNVMFNSNVCYIDETINDIDDTLSELLGLEDDNIPNLEVKLDIKRIVDDTEYKILVDRYVNGYKISEIAKKMGRNRVALGYKINGCLKRIKDELHYIV